MKYVLYFLGILLIASCNKDTPNITKKGVLPTVKTVDATNIFSSQANAGGIITSEGSSVVTEKGVCWSTVPGPTKASSRTIDGGGAASFTSLMINLSPFTKYYFRAYATNSEGTAYGLTYQLITLQGTFLNSKGVTDIDGNSYQTVRIGTSLSGYQEWMAEDLKTTRFNDGVVIKNELNDSIWQHSNTAAYRYYNNDPTNKSKLYNYHVVANGNVCPSGWHVPNTSDWEIIFSKLGSHSEIHGKLMKSPGTLDWEIPGGTNSSGFGGTGTGGVTSSGTFEKNKKEGRWWTSTNISNERSYAYFLYSNLDEILINSITVQNGIAIRCVKDN